MCYCKLLFTTSEWTAKSLAATAVVRVRLSRFIRLCRQRWLSYEKWSKVLPSTKYHCSSLIFVYLLLFALSLWWCVLSVQSSWLFQLPFFQTFKFDDEYIHIYKTFSLFAWNSYSSIRLGHLLLFMRLTCAAVFLFCWITSILQYAHHCRSSPSFLTTNIIAAMCVSILGL